MVEEFAGFKLWQRGDKFYAVWQEKGDTRQKTLKTKDRKEAVRRLKQFALSRISGKTHELDRTKGISLSQFSEEFLADVEKKKRPRTKLLFETALKKAQQTLGDVDIKRITNRDIDRIMSDMLNSGLKVPTVNKNLRHLKASLRKAYDWEYLEKPISFPPQIREDEVNRRIPDDAFRDIFAAINDQEFYDFCFLSACTGMRSSEILRLNWRDIDFDRREIRITSEQKNRKESVIPINASALEVLKRAKARNGIKVFRFTKLTWMSQKFKRAVRKAGYEQYRFHDFRHTFVTKLIEDGVDVSFAQKLVRHKSIATTMKYVHLSDESLKRASGKINYGPMPLASGNRS